VLVGWDGSGELLEPGACQKVSRFEGRGVCPYQLENGGAGGLWGERVAELPGVLLLGLAAASSVRLDRRAGRDRSAA
jgi:hypothetical protein